MMRIDSECVSASDSVESLPSVKAYLSQNDKEEIEGSVGKKPACPSKDQTPDSNNKR